jgi:replication-associated recombination protein RarA
MFAEQLDHLRNYQKMRWGLCASSRWISLCDALREYDAPCRSFAIHRERKWELVSALQKTIRRGDKQTALRLISAMDGMPAEYAYFWRRLCVIACEDVGLADDVLTAFVVACATVFPPKSTGTKNYDLFCFLAEQMCDLSTRSRIYCSYSIIESIVSKAGLVQRLEESFPLYTNL